jgi:hypothetical protein
MVGIGAAGRPCRIKTLSRLPSDSRLGLWKTAARTSGAAPGGTPQRSLARSAAVVPPRRAAVPTGAYCWNPKPSA